MAPARTTARTAGTERRRRGKRGQSGRLGWRSAGADDGEARRAALDSGGVEKWRVEARLCIKGATDGSLGNQGDNSQGVHGVQGDGVHGVQDDGAQGPQGGSLNQNNDVAQDFFNNFQDRVDYAVHHALINQSGVLVITLSNMMKTIADGSIAEHQAAGPVYLQGGVFPNYRCGLTDVQPSIHAVPSVAPTTQPTAPTSTPLPATSAMAPGQPMNPRLLTREHPQHSGQVANRPTQDQVAAMFLPPQHAVDPVPQQPIQQTPPIQQPNLHNYQGGNLSYQYQPPSPQAQYQPGGLAQPQFTSHYGQFEPMQQQSQGAAQQRRWADVIADVMREQFGLKPKETGSLYRQPYPEWFERVPLPNRFKVPDFSKFSGQDGVSTYEHISRFLAQYGEASAVDALKGMIAPIREKFSSENFDSLSHLIQKVTLHEHRSAEVRKSSKKVNHVCPYMYGSDDEEDDSEIAAAEWVRSKKVFRQQIQVAIEGGKIMFDDSKKPMKVDGNPFHVNMVHTAGQTTDRVRAKGFQVNSAKIINKYQRKYDKQQEKHYEEYDDGFDPHWGCEFFRFYWNEGMRLPSIENCPGCSDIVESSSQSYNRGNRLRQARVSVKQRLGPVNQDRGQEDEVIRKNQWCPSGIFMKNQKRRVQRLKNRERLQEVEQEINHRLRKAKPRQEWRVKNQVPVADDVAADEAKRLAKGKSVVVAPINMVFTLLAEFGIDQADADEVEEELAKLVLSPEQAVFEKPEGTENRHLKPLYINGYVNGKPMSKMMVDGRAAVNLMPYATFRKLGRNAEDLIKTNMVLKDFGGNPSETKGVLNVELTVGSKTIPTTFFVIDGKGSYSLLLGRDWIHANCCIPSTMHQCLIQWQGDKIEIVSVDSQLKMENPSYYFKGVVEGSNVYTKDTVDDLDDKQGVRPRQQPLRRCKADMLEPVKAEIKRLYDAGFIRPCRYAEWVSSIVPVIKKNGKVRVCIDFRDLNKATPKDEYPMPVADQLVDAASGNKILSFMDGNAGYNQIFMAEEDIHKTAFRCPGAIGLFEWVVMTFGLRSAGATYQRAMNYIYHDLIGWLVEVYIDDVVVKSREIEDHIADLRKVFERTRKYGLKMNPTKCAFGVSAGQFLGFLVHERGIEAIKGQAIADFIVEHRDDSIGLVEIVPWTLFFDESVCTHGCGIGLVIISPSGACFEFAYTITPYATNNQAEYEAVLKGVQLLKEVEADTIEIMGDSLLVISQLAEEYECKNDTLMVYNEKCQELMKEFRLAKVAIGEVHEGVCGTHQSAHKMKWLLRHAGYFWPTMLEDCFRYYKGCQDCQKFGAIQRAPASAMNPIIKPWPFRGWGIDIISMINPPSSKGHKFILVATDYFTKWVEEIPLKKVDSRDAIQFVQEHIIYRFGLPQTITTDQGSIFVSDEFVQFTDSMGIKLLNSSPYYAQVNGQAEASNKSLIKLIKRKIFDYPWQWHTQLAEALWSYRMACHGSIQVPPYKLVYGHEAVLPWEVRIGSRRTELQNDLTADEYYNLMANEREDLVQSRLRALAKVTKYKERIARHYNKKVVPKDFSEGELVWKLILPIGTRDSKFGKWSPNWEGPFQIYKVVSKGAYMLQGLDGEVYGRALNGKYLKKYYPSVWVNA
uniref:Retrotransposon protein, putative, unclassified n=1 Tax=Oryza sativa subsp. japonica TaxID=39947 RepID=Q10HF6_ORYSJ|nr:retrotransposon protein, putative, unclassified [Oryza sativa Japonica Group]